MVSGIRLRIQMERYLGALAAQKKAGLCPAFS